MLIALIALVASTTIASAQNVQNVQATNAEHIIPMRTERAPELAWLCPICKCGGSWICNAVHARARRLIVNFDASCTHCGPESETAESIIDKTAADLTIFDVAYPFRSVDTCSGYKVTCVLCDNVTGVESNCGRDNVGKYRLDRKSVV